MTIERVITLGILEEMFDLLSERVKQLEDVTNDLDVKADNLEDRIEDCEDHCGIE